MIRKSGKKTIGAQFSESDTAGKNWHNDRNLTLHRGSAAAEKDEDRQLVNMSFISRIMNSGPDAGLWLRNTWIETGGPKRGFSATRQGLDAFLILLVLCCRSLLIHWHRSYWADWPS